MVLYLYNVGRCIYGASRRFRNGHILSVLVQNELSAIADPCTYPTLKKVVPMKDSSVLSTAESIDLSTITPADVWQGFNDGTGRGDFTPLGRQILKSDPELAELRARQSQHDHSQKYPRLYPQVTGERPADRPELLRGKPAPGPTHKRMSLPDAELPKFFGPTSNGGMANNLVKANPALYEGSKERAIELGFLSPIRSRIGRK